MMLCPLTQTVRLVGLAMLVGVGCGKDPILEAVDEMATVSGEDRAAASPAGVGVPEEPEPGEPTDPSPGDAGGVPGEPGQAGVAEQPDKGVPEEPKPGVPSEPTPAAAGSADRPEPPPSQAGQGEPDEPQPGVPDEPQPAPPGSPGGAAHQGKMNGEEERGPEALIRGRIDAPGGSGMIRIDLFDGDQRNVAGPRPKVVGVHEISSPGGFEVSIPQSHKRVWVGAYRDLNGNKRPDKGEPSGWYPRNPVYLDSLPSSVIISLEVEGKASGLGLDFGE